MTTAASERATKLTGIAPQFLVDDLDRAIAYYRDKLGFELDFKYQPFYAAVTRDGFAIRLKCAPKFVADREHRKQNEHLAAYVQRIDEAWCASTPAARRKTVGMPRLLCRGS